MSIKDEHDEPPLAAILDKDCADDMGSIVAADVKKQIVPVESRPQQHNVQVVTQAVHRVGRPGKLEASKRQTLQELHFVSCSHTVKAVL